MKFRTSIPAGVLTTPTTSHIMPTMNEEEYIKFTFPFRKRDLIQAIKNMREELSVVSPTK